MTETEIQRLDAFLGRYFKLAPLLHFCFDEQGTVVSASSYAVQMYAKFFHRELMGVNILAEEVAIPPVHEAVKERKNLRTMIHFNVKKGCVENTLTARHIDDFLTFVMLVFPVFDDDGTFLANYMMLRDITAYQREGILNRIASDKLDILTRQLGIAHFSYSPLDDTFDVFGGRDNHWVIGAPSEQVMKGIVHPDDREHMLSVLRTISTKDTKEVHFSARMVSHALHCYRLFKCDLIPQFYENGEFAYYAGFGMDVTDIVNQLKQQRESYEETIATLRQDAQNAVEKEKGMGTMLSSMGHDLRSPLGTISGFAELLAYTDDPNEKAEYYRIIKSSVEQMSMLVNDILEANRLETGRMIYKITTFDVKDIMGELYQSNLLRFKDLPIELVYEPDGCEVVLKSDMQRVLEVLGNFVGNAIKYTEKGSVTLKYELADGGVYMHVIDTGRGIAPENHEKIFNRFEMLDSEIKGNGLGLYICREIAHGLGGRTGVNSAIGKGSDFWLWMPIDANE